MFTKHADTDLLVRVSRLYFELGENQQRIAEIVGFSRPQVSRLLRQARQEGIVDIRVIDPRTTDRGLETALRGRFGLRSVLLSPRLSGSEDLIRRMLGRAGARYIRGALREGNVVGLGGGSTVAAMLDSLSSWGQYLGTTVVPLIGGTGHTLQANELARRFSQRVGGVALELACPGLVGTPDLRRAMLSDASVQEVTAYWDRLDIAVLGIGAPTWDERLLGTEVSRELERRGAVGELLARPYNMHGRFIAADLGTRTIGIEPDQLRRVPVSIAIAGGDSKIHPLLGALRSGVFKVLITDQETAASILDIDRSTRGPASEVAPPRTGGT